MRQSTRPSQRARSSIAEGVRPIRRGGFTLIELLVVIAIIALLVAISLPSMHRTIRQARTTVCKSNLKEVFVAIDMYRTENHGWLPTVQGADAFRTSQTWWSRLVDPLPGIRGVLICPDDPWASVLMDQIQHNQFGVDGPGSYGLNDFIVSSPNGFLANLGRYSPRRPDDTLLLADLGPDVVPPGTSEYSLLGPPSRNFGRLAVDDLFRPGAAPGRRTDSWLTGRHLGSINILTLVGNVRSVSVASVIKRPLASYYSACSAGDCTLCRYLDVPHYSFYEGRTYWWTGPAPVP